MHSRLNPNPEALPIGRLSNPRKAGLKQCERVWTDGRENLIQSVNKTRTRPGTDQVVCYISVHCTASPTFRTCIPVCRIRERILASSR